MKNPKSNMKYIAFLRGINVGGNTMLSMQELVLLCIDAGLTSVRTYLNSGNVIFENNHSEVKLKESLEKVLRDKKGKDIPVVIRSAKELHSILSHNPFQSAHPSKVGVMLFTKPVANSFVDDVINIGLEEIVLARREIYIHFPNGMGRSKLKFRTTGEAGTVRNINTIRKLVELSSI